MAPGRHHIRLLRQGAVVRRVLETSGPQVCGACALARVCLQAWRGQVHTFGVEGEGTTYSSAASRLAAEHCGGQGDNVIEDVQPGEGARRGEGSGPGDGAPGAATGAAGRSGAGLATGCSRIGDDGC